MKKITLILSAAAIACSVGLTSCKKKAAADTLGCMDPTAFNYNKAATKDDGTCQLPQTDVKSAVFDKTGLWCHVCGEYGTPAFEQASTTLKGMMVPFSMHNGDAFSCTAGDNWLNGYWKGGGTPSYAEGDKWLLQNGVYADVKGNVNKITQAVNSRIAKDIIVGTGLSKSISGNTLTVTANTKFANAASGVEYYQAIYILENGLVADQVTDHGTVSMTHNHVIRHCFSAVETGDLIASGNIDAGKVITKTYTKNIPATWKANNLVIASVIYYKDGSSSALKFENANILE